MLSLSQFVGWQIFPVFFSQQLQKKHVWWAHCGSTSHLTPVRVIKTTACRNCKNILFWFSKMLFQLTPMGVLAPMVAYLQTSPYFDQIDVAHNNTIADIATEIWLSLLYYYYITIMV